ncbi:uracil-DNA glycosylase [Calothrix sp. PCC 6303]|uniref:uracil-DNA glycosylase n=1 Tax=Calothrix sp. PCC 6303 TaxID=1170562 RepID=UPI0002A0537D|nr:uracil-DNA glycosylase [Calothrix sp. PCC 6303]AFZ04174.1 phage SPO1 DNA polymerase-related protein [Calothrix sp. PCC 6303]
MNNSDQLSLFTTEESNIKSDSKSLIPTDVKIPIPPKTYTDISEIATHCNQCYRCGLGATRTKAVVGRGNPKATIMIIGEAPGQNEDETGLPFVGRAGKLLEKILESVRLDSEKDVYIGNIIKCRPPNNRVPSSKEIAACKPYIFEQIRLVDPKIILLTGATAVKGLIGDQGAMSTIRGKWIEWEGRLCMPIFHPSYLLRNPSREVDKPKWLMWQDIQVVRAKFDEIQSQG